MHVGPARFRFMSYENCPADAAMPVKKLAHVCEVLVNEGWDWRREVGERCRACRHAAAVARHASPELVTLERGRLRVEIGLRPFAVTVRRAGRRLLRAARACGSPRARARPLRRSSPRASMANEELAPHERAVRATVGGSSGAAGLELRGRAADGGRAARLRLALRRWSDRVSWRLTADGEPLRLAFDWDRRSRGAVRRARRPPLHPVRAGRPRGPARRRPALHRPGLPTRDARRRRDPAGRLRAGAVAAVEPRLRRVWVRTEANGTRFDLSGERTSVSTRLAAGPLQARVPVRPPPRRRGCAHFCRLTGFPAGAARVGLRLLEEPRRPRAPGRRARRLRGFRGPGSRSTRS